MNREEARYYLQSSGFSEEQINTIEQAFKPKPTDDATLRDIFCMGCEYKKQDPCNTCGYEEGSIYCKEHCPYEAKIEQEPCEDAISRQAVCKIIDDIRDCVSVNGYWAFLERLKKLPPVTPQPKTGRWVAYEVRLPDRTILNYRCSVCGRKLIGYSTETLSEAPFCHCGAKMVEPQERSDKE